MDWDCSTSRRRDRPAAILTVRIDNYRCRFCGKHLPKGSRMHYSWTLGGICLLPEEE